jgi:kumamolisin
MRVVANTADLRGARDLGRAPALAPVRLVFGVQLRDERGLDALVAAQSNRLSPFYHHFLRPQQLRDAFGATAPHYAAMLATLTRAGFAVRPDPLRTVIDATAPAGLVERYFATRLDIVTYDGRRLALANVRPAVLPAEMEKDVTGVTGLTTAPLYETAAAQAFAAGKSGGPSPAQATPVPTPSPVPTPPGTPPANGPDGGYGPQLITASFDAPVRHGYSGSGVAVADLIDGTISDPNDIAPYLAEFGVERTGPRTKTVIVDGGCGGEDECFDSFSAVIDAQGILGVAPGAAYFIYELPSLSDAGILDGLTTIVNDDRADVVNIAFAGCETLIGEAAFEFDREFTLGSAEGITFSAVAFGGSNPCGTNGPSVQAPADSPNVLTVGGADSFANPLSGLTSPQIANTGTGGGVSELFAEPSYQAGVSGALSGGRNLPDLDGPAAINGVGPSIYFAEFGGWIGGFAFVDNAPLTGGIAEVAQIGGSRLGAVNPAIYSVYAAQGYGGNVFRDITEGCNGVEGGGPYCAIAGFDHVSGIGTPNLYKLARKL